MQAISEADLLIDATTTLAASRDLSDFDLEKMPRLASAFLTPSGWDSVLLMEDKNRTIRLSELEPQYYRAIINKGWGNNHLSGHHGEISVGAGCRDVSMVISYELISLHSAIFARQIRKRVDEPKACIFNLVSN